MTRVPAVPIVVSVLLVTGLAVGGATVGAQHGAEAASYAGTHVTFDATGEAITNYTVQGDQVIGSLEVESASDAEARGLLGVGLVAVTSVEAAPISLDAESETSAHLAAESGGSIEAHDSERGHLLVAAEDDGQVVVANLSSGAEASQASETRVVVDGENGSEGTFIVVGEGSVTVNEDGNVTAEVEQGSRLVYRQYDDGRDDADERDERLIENGTAAAEVYVTSTGSGSSNAEADVVEYGSDTTVEVVTAGEGEVRMTADRTEEEGRVIIAQVSEAAVDSAEDVRVRVDGSAATRVSSMGELTAATEDGETSAFMVRQAASAESSAEVLIGVNHFSEREILLQGGDASTGGTDDDPDKPGDPMPGFGVAIAVGTLLLAAAIAAHRNG